MLDRPDLRNRMAKEMNRYHTHLKRLENAPNVDRSRLIQLIQQIEEITAILHGNNGKFAQPLRENELLNSIRLHISTPGGLCHFDVPHYHWWLQQPIELRKQQLKNWLQEFHEVRTVVQFFLGLTRQSSTPIVKIAQKGFYQESLDPQLPIQLIRVSLPADNCCPQISLGRYGISIRFYDVKLEGNSTPTQADVEFELACCVF